MAVSSGARQRYAIVLWAHGTARLPKQWGQERGRGGDGYELSNVLMGSRMMGWHAQSKCIGGWEGGVGAL